MQVGSRGDARERYELSETQAKALISDDDAWHSLNGKQLSRFVAFGWPQYFYERKERS